MRACKQGHIWLSIIFRDRNPPSFDGRIDLDPVSVIYLHALLGMLLIESASRVSWAGEVEVVEDVGISRLIAPF